MVQKEFWRGVEGVEFIWHGEWADPELRYGNIVANCVEVEDYLQSYAADEVADNDRYEENFTMWCREHRVEVIKAIYEHQTYDSKRYNFFDTLDGGDVCFHEPVGIGNLWIYIVYLDENLRMWGRDIDDVDYEIEQKSEFDERKKEFVRYYGGSDIERNLINTYAEQCFGQWRDAC